MRLQTRKLLDRSFSALGVVSIVLMVLSLVVLLGPIVVRGARAYVFRGTVEFRRMQLDLFAHGRKAAVDREVAAAAEARRPIYEKLQAFEQQLKDGPRADRRTYRKPLRDLEAALAELLGPPPGAREPVLLRDRYGQTRWDRAQVKLQALLYRTKWDYSDPSGMGKKVLVPRAEEFAGTPVAAVFPYTKDHLAELLRPRWTFYGRFLTDTAKDAHFFGGIWAEVLGTLYLTLGAMLFAIPVGVIAAIYLCEYAGDHPVVSLLRTFISTLAGVPSIVFGLFGLAFFLNTLHVSDSKSVLAGSLTLALLILPTVIRASEEAILSVPHAYKEAALGLGAGRWHTVLSVVLPAALPGILTGVVISMGRAAGETAPIIFTAAVSVGRPLSILQAFSEPTPALPWNIYNLCTEHEAVDEIRHVQYGMVFTLVALVLLLNVAALVLRARVTRKLRG